MLLTIVYFILIMNQERRWLQEKVESFKRFVGIKESFKQGRDI